MNARRLVVSMCFISVLGWGAACRSPVRPSNSLTGAWTGAFSEGAGDSGTVALTLTQVGPGITGAFTSSSMGSLLGRSGTVAGTLDGAVLSLALKPDTAIACAGFTLSGTAMLTGAVDGARMSGSLVTLTCTGAAGGSVDLKRE